MRKILLYFSLKYQGDYHQIYQAIQKKEKVSLEELNDIEKEIKCSYITIIDSQYPENFKQIPNPPWVLYYYGDIKILNHYPKLALIGTRKNSDYGRQMCEQLVKESAVYDCVIISGLAQGIDGIAHQNALKFKIPTIAILGSGIDYCYPKQNYLLYKEIKDKGLLISEYPNQVKPQRNYFLIRNRLIAALCDQIVVVESNYHSGTMNTITYALEYGKDIGCVPALANLKSGCNYLIKQGAKLIENAKDIFE